MCVCVSSQTSHYPLTQSHPRSRCTPRLCGGTEWWPRRSPPALALPAAPAAPAPSLAGYLGVETHTHTQKRHSHL